MAHSNRSFDPEAECEALTVVELELESQDAELARVAAALARSRDGAVVVRALSDALRALGEETPAPPTLRMFATPPMFGTRC